MPIDFDAQVRLADLRMRVLNGDTVTAAEYRQVVDDLRRGREAMALDKRKSAKTKKTAEQPKLDLSSLF